MTFYYDKKDSFAEKIMTTEQFLHLTNSVRPQLLENNQPIRIQTEMSNEVTWEPL